MAIDFTELFGDYTGDSSDSYSLEDSMNDLFDTSSEKGSTFNYVPSTTTDYSDYFDDDFKLKDFKGNLLDDNYLKNLDFSGMDLTDYGFEDTTSTDGIKSLDDSLTDKIIKFFTGAKGEKREGNKLGAVGQGLGDFLSSPLAQLLLLKDQYDGRKADLYVPTGTEAFGDSGGQSSYGIPNLQPALLPGMAYANQPTTFNADPPGMQAGGLTGLSQKIGKGIDNYAISPYLSEVGFFENPSFEKYVEGARLYNQNTNMPGILKSAAPFIDDSFAALQDGYEAFLKSFNSKRGVGSMKRGVGSMEGVTEAGQEAFNADPPGMQAGGLMAIPQGNKGLPNLPQSVRNNMGYMEAGGVASLENMMDGPGDITQAMLEPGEFVMTRKATENLTPEYLYNLMHQAENAGRR